ncbi:MAG TPA: hypothetical protein VNA66_13400 [Gammaproteobacteria bacterium]|nr:hypothetical protein [Gammaproteobacteria bacterium]
MKTLASTLVEELWRQHFVAYEDALTSFYALQDEVQVTLEQSYSMGGRLNELEALRRQIFEVRRQFRASADDGRVVEIERPTATLELDGVPFGVMDLVANRAASDATVLELSFRVDPLTIPRFVKLTTPIRIKFPFGESTYVAVCRLVRFRMIRNQFVFHFATVDPI